MSTLSAIQKTIDSQNKAKAIKVEPNSADTSLVDGKEVGVLVSGSNGTTGVYSGSVTVEAGDSGHGRLGGDVTISSGDGFYAGNVYVFGGSNLTEPPLTTFGGIYLYTGGVDKENLLTTSTSTTSTGLISIQTGDVSADNITSGQIIIKSGSPHTHTGSVSGGITIQSGGTSSTANAGHTGLIEIKTGQGGTDESGSIDLITGRTSTAPSGNVIINTGRTTTATSGTLSLFTGDSTDGNTGSITMASGSTRLAHISGAVTIQSGESEEANSGNVTVKSGNPQADGDSGNLLLESGQVIGGSSGSVFVKSGSSTALDSGTVYLFSETAGRNTGALEMRTGNSTINGDSGAINLYTGNALNNTHSSGAISIYSGQGHTTSGALNLYSGNTTSGASGNVSLKSGVATGGVSGDATLKTETSNVRSGDLTLSTGNNTGASGSSGPSGEIGIITGTTDGSPSGIITIATGDNAGGGSGGVVIKSGAGTSTGGISISTSEPTNGNSGGIDLYTSGTDTGSTGEIMIYTGLNGGAVGTSGAIYISTGNSDASSGSGELGIQSGNTSAGASGDTYLKSGNAGGGQDSGNVSISTGNANNSGDINLTTGTGTTTRGEVKVVSNSTPTYAGTEDRMLLAKADGTLKNTTYVHIDSATDKFSSVAPGDHEYSTSGGNFEISAPGGNISIDDSSATKISNPTTYNRFFGLNGSGSISTLNIQTLGYGTVVIGTPSSGDEISYIPLFFKDEETNVGGSDLDLTIGTGETYASLYESYSGKSIWSGTNLQSWITPTNLSVSVELTVNSSAPFTDYDYWKFPILNVDIATLGGTPYLRLVFSDTGTQGIDVNGTGTTESLHIHYVLKHRAY